MARDGKQGGSLSQDPLDRLSNFGVLSDKWEAKSRELAVIDPVELASYLKSKVIGQNAVVDSVVARLHRRMAAKRPNKPIAVFCFAGAPGVGKTYLAQILAEKIYGSPKNLHYIDMTKFGSEATSWTLFGSASGHVGSNKPGLLPRYLRDIPNSVVLLDEIEKAHRSILTQFLSAWNDGFITEMSDGSKHSTAEAIFIMTTNAGRSRINEYTRDPKITQEELNKLAKGALEDAQFAPEVLSRVDDVFAFRELAGLDIARVVALEIEKTAKSYGLEIAGQGIDPEILMTAIDEFTENKPSGGVREIARHIEDKIADGLIDARAAGAKAVMFEADGPDVRVIPVEAPTPSAGNAEASDGTTEESR